MRTQAVSKHIQILIERANASVFEGRDLRGLHAFGGGLASRPGDLGRRDEEGRLGEQANVAGVVGVKVG